MPLLSNSPEFVPSCNEGQRAQEPKGQSCATLDSALSRALVRYELAAATRNRFGARSIAVKVGRNDEGDQEVGSSSGLFASLF